MTRTRVRALLGAVVIAFSMIVGVPVANAATGSTYLCGPDWAGYSCMAGTGYSGQSVWGSWGPGHNCVSYAAYRLQQNGAAKPWSGQIGNANEWDEKARAAGWPVDTNPVVGS